MHHKILEQIIQ